MQNTGGVNKLSLLEAALEYVNRAWYVFPIKPGTKVPATQHGFKDASIDGMQIVKWWTENPEYNIGIATEASGLMVIDFDPRNYGPEAPDLFDKVSGGVEVVTPQGGSHFYFQLPEGKHKKELVAGVDIKGLGGYVLAPPSSTSDGTYNWMATGVVDPPPEWLQNDCKAILRPSREYQYSGTTPLDYRPGSLYNADASWTEILEPHGWSILRVEDNRTYWTRPGKDAGTSAVSGGDEGDYFWTWSTSTPLEADTSYTKFGLYAALNFNGDFQAAAASLKDRYTSGGIRVTASRVSVAEPDVVGPPPDGDHRGWVKSYISYAERQTDAFKGYHEGSSLALLSTIVGNTRANLSIGKLPLNLYVLLVGPSTRSRKSTSQRIGLELLDQVLPAARLPDRMTGEAAIYHLAAKGYQSHIWAPDEFGVTLGQMFARDSYMKPLEELLLTLYSGQNYAYRTVKNNATINEVNLSILAAATPESLALAGPQAQLGGLLPRFGCVFPAGSNTPRALAQGQDLTAEKQELVNHLRTIFTMCASKSNQLVNFSKGSMDILGDLERSLEGNITTARLPVMGYKVASLLALADQSLLVTTDHAESAVHVINRWADSANRLEPYLRRKTSDLELDRLIESVMQFLKNHNGTAYRTDVARNLKLDSTTTRRVYETLVEWGMIDVHIEDGQHIWSATFPSN